MNQKGTFAEKNNLLLLPYYFHGLSPCWRAYLQQVHSYRTAQLDRAPNRVRTRANRYLTQRLSLTVTYQQVQWFARCVAHYNLHHFAQRWVAQHRYGQFAERLGRGYAGRAGAELLEIEAERRGLSVDLRGP